MHVRFLLLVILTVLCAVDSYKILGLFPHPGKSHVDVFLPLMKALAGKGHEVTVVSHFPLKKPLPRYNDVNITESVGIGPIINFFNLEDIGFARISRHLQVKMLEDLAVMACDAALKSEALQQFLKTKQTFDVILLEAFNTDCFLGVVHKFHPAPFMGISSSALLHWMNARYGNPTHPAYIPNLMLDYSDRIGFLGRVENTLAGIFQNAFYKRVINRHDEEAIRKYVDGDVPDLDEIRRNVSMILVNTHFSFNLPRPLAPGVVEIGGIHVGKPAVLPKDLEKWINESTHGVIYFSLGSMIKGHTFPEEQRQAFLRAFARLPQRVLWKWETDTMPGKPDNVMIQKWMPQLDILSHPNVKAFISHGGLLGMTEAVHCGVPAVVMPQYGDQFTNAKALEANGGGVILNLREATEEKVYNALKTVLDPNFRKGAQELSARFRDRPLPPLETAIYWVEYVARHRGAHHMRTAAVDMPFYKYFLLDVIAFLLIVFGTISACMIYITRLMVRKMFCGKSQTAKVKTN